MVGCIVLSTGSSQSSDMDSNLALSHLDSFKINLYGSLRFDFRQYIVTSLRLSGTLKPFLLKQLILASIVSTVVEQMS